MKLVKKFVLAVLFVSALAVNVNAGDLETPTLVPPPPAPERSTTSITQNSNEVSDSTVDISNDLIYDAWVALLSLF
ncbi:MAG TPA: hypothetical protein VLB68_17745 [Pyrinomonadaceae bacterium]|nr:hypothetical protein [Pyrinomonadaceae bacterium]